LVELSLHLVWLGDELLLLAGLQLLVDLWLLAEQWLLVEVLWLV
jgi:hypothetical protein